jgi:hypothetical protein
MKQFYDVGMEFIAVSEKRKDDINNNGVPDYQENKFLADYLIAEQSRLSIKQMNINKQCSKL